MVPAGQEDTGFAGVLTVSSLMLDSFGGASGLAGGAGVASGAAEVPAAAFLVRAEREKGLTRRAPALGWRRGRAVARHIHVLQIMLVL